MWNKFPRGEALIDVIVGTTILGVFSITIFGSLNNLLRKSAEATRQVQAVWMANSIMEYFISIPFDNLLPEWTDQEITFNGDIPDVEYLPYEVFPGGEIVPGMQATVSIDLAQFDEEQFITIDNELSEPDYKQITVTVTDPALDVLLSLTSIVSLNSGGGVGMGGGGGGGGGGEVVASNTAYFSAAVGSWSEGGAPGSALVRLIGVAEEDVELDFTVSEGDPAATSKIDFVFLEPDGDNGRVTVADNGLSGTVTIKAGQLSFPIAWLNKTDAETEETEKFVLTLSSSDDAVAVNEGLNINTNSIADIENIIAEDAISNKNLPGEYIIGMGVDLTCSDLEDGTDAVYVDIEPIAAARSGSDFYGYGRNKVPYNRYRIRESPERFLLTEAQRGSGASWDAEAEYKGYGYRDPGQHLKTMRASSDVAANTGIPNIGSSVWYLYLDQRVEDLDVAACIGNGYYVKESVDIDGTPVTSCIRNTLSLGFHHDVPFNNDSEDYDDYDGDLNALEDVCPVFHRWCRVWNGSSWGDSMILPDGQDHKDKRGGELDFKLIWHLPTDTDNLTVLTEYDGGDNWKSGRHEFPGALLSPVWTAKDDSYEMPTPHWARWGWDGENTDGGVIELGRSDYPWCVEIKPYDYRSHGSKNMWHWLLVSDFPKDVRTDVTKEDCLNWNELDGGKVICKPDNCGSHEVPWRWNVDNSTDQVWNYGSCEEDIRIPLPVKQGGTSKVSLGSASTIALRYTPFER